MATIHRHPVKNCLHSWLLERGEAYMHRKYGPRKRAIFGRLPASVVEIGSGPGANLRYYPPGTRITAIEPNAAMHAPLRANAAYFRCGGQVATGAGNDAYALCRKAEQCQPG